MKPEAKQKDKEVLKLGKGMRTIFLGEGSPCMPRFGPIRCGPVSGYQLQLEENKE